MKYWIEKQIGEQNLKNLESDLLQLLQSLNEIYIPAICSLVSLEEYAQKLTKYAEIYFAKFEENNIGLLALYNNDLLTRTAYISSIGVLSSFHGRGIGRMLIARAFASCQKSGMTNIRLEVSKENIDAICFYQKHGFVFSPKASSRKGMLSMEQKIKYENVIFSEESS